MKTSTLLIIAAAAILPFAAATAAPLKSAIVTTVVKDVKISESRSAARPIGTGTKMTGSSTLLTGAGSLAAMTFPDKTVTRVGANSVFRFSSGSREMEIVQGSFLLQVPKNAGGAKIRTATVTAAITGTTTMMEYSPGHWLKFICFEGEVNLRNQSGDTINVLPGQMIIMHPDARKFPQPVIVKIEKLMKTSRLMDEEVFGPVDDRALDLIGQTVADQMDRRSGGGLLPSGVLVSGPVGAIENGGDPQSNPRTLLQPMRELRPHSGLDGHGLDGQGNPVPRN